MRKRIELLVCGAAMALVCTSCGGGGSSESPTPSPWSSTAPTPTPTSTPTPAIQPVGGTPNVLFIILDDLRTDLGVYGNASVKTPNIDRLAAQGATFDRSFVSQSICAPSRASLLTGLRPDTTGIQDLSRKVDTALPQVKTLPDIFRAAGYETLTVGKVYHDPGDDADGFSLRLPEAPDEFGNYIAEYATRKWPNREEMHDAKNVLRASQELTRLATSGKPFFFAVGLRKPHMPFSCPQEDWDKYSPDTIPPPINAEGQKDNYPWSFFIRTDPWGYKDLKDLPAPRLPSDVATQLKWGYYACISYDDSLVGELLKALDDNKLSNNTIVILWGDHGWKLGDHGFWGKSSNADIDLRVPMIMAAPGRIAPGSRIKRIVEAVDIYPTLAHMAGIPMPDNLEGLSFVPLFLAPDRPWKQAAFAQYGRPAYLTQGHGDLMGRTVRTEQYRYTAWVNTSGTVVGKELFDLAKDPNETTNVASTFSYSSVVEQLEKLRLDGWKGVRAELTK